MTTAFDLKLFFFSCVAVALYWPAAVTLKGFADTENLKYLGLASCLYFCGNLAVVQQLKHRLAFGYVLSSLSVTIVVVSYSFFDGEFTTNRAVGLVLALCAIFLMSSGPGEAP